LKKFMQEFRDFVATGNMVELAVAFILAVAVKAVIDAFVEQVALPIIAGIVGKPNFDEVLAFSIDDARVRIGAVLTQIVNLILVGLVLFLAIKAYNRFRKQPEAAASGPTEIELLTEIRDELRGRR
jgi:large conductance mechanosensitive channel